jgi:ADP-heptose:LPS heptosyltransferase
VAWRGNPKNSNDRNRSADLVDIERHLSPDMDWLCLHHDLDGPERRCAESIGHLSIPLDGDTDLEDAAAICAIADAVVTVDTSFAHIAGALGKTSFVMLPFTPDWRWMMRRHDSPWYPQMILCRQDEGRDWGPVMRDVGVALRARLAD